MDLDAMLAGAAPARNLPLDGPDSPAAAGLYQRITAQPPAAAPAFRRPRFGLPALMATAVAAVAAITALALIGGSAGGARHAHHGGPAGTALAAWSVTKERHGLVTVTIRELRDPVGLRRTLRADGVPAYVRFLKHDFTPTTSAHDLPRSCRAPRMSDEANANLQGKIMPGDGSASNNVVLTIRPAAIPPGIGLFLEAWAASPGTANGPYLSVQTDLVQVSPQCTGK